jgi:hypothetical protein
MLLDHSLVLAGGGFIGSGSTAKRSLVGTIELAFEIHLILFADGEIAGPHPDHFAIELQARNQPPNLSPSKSA